MADSKNNKGSVIVLIILLVVQTFTAVKEFLWTYYRELISIFGLGLMVTGLLGWTAVFEIAFILFFAGYLLVMVIWHVPTRHEYFRGITTTMSGVVFIWGLYSLVLSGNITPDPLIQPLLVSFLFTATSGYLPVLLWRVELRNLVVQTVEAFVQFLKDTGNILVSFISKALTQLKQLSLAIINSIIPIILFSFSITTILYSFFIIIYTMIPPIGIALDDFLISYVPGLDVLASILQSEDITIVTLIGDFAIEDFTDLLSILSNLIFGGIIIIVGTVGFLIIARFRGSMQLQSLLNRTGSQINPPSGKNQDDTNKYSKGDNE